MKRKDVLSLIASIAIAESIGIIGGLFTVSTIHTWYALLTKPYLNPPNAVFQPVWTLLYALMGAAAYLVGKEAGKRREGKEALEVYALQLLINLLWTIVFFGLEDLRLALIVIVILAATIVWNIILFYRISRSAAYLLLPYLAWVLFATYLNYGLYKLN